MSETASWQKLQELPGLWGIEKWNRAGWHWRATALALPGGGSLVVGPLKLAGDDAFHQLEQQVGRPALVLAPNHFHYLAIPAYRERYDDLVVACAEAARPRLGKKQGGDFADLSAVSERLPAGVQLLQPPGIRAGEVWLRIESGAGVGWVVSDAFFNLQKNATGFMGFMLRVTGTAPGLRIGRTFTTLHMSDKKAYRAWLRDRLEADRPTVLVPGHGAIASGDDLADRLIALADRRLGSPRG